MRAEALTCKISHVRLSPQSFPALCNPLGCNLPAPLSMGFSRQECWSGLHALLQGIFPTQGSNPGLLHCSWILYQLSHQESPRILE